MPHFITHYLPSGLKGLVIAGALAAAMSTLSACINSASMVVVQDLYKKVRRDKSDEHYLKAAKGCALLMGLLMIAGSAVIYVTATMTLTDMVLTVVAIISSGVPGIFLAGMLTRRATLTGAWAGLFLSLMFVLWTIGSRAGSLPTGLRIEVFPYYVAIVGNAISFGTAYLIGRIRSEPGRDLTNLTVWDGEAKPLE